MEDSIYNVLGKKTIRTLSSPEAVNAASGDAIDLAELYKDYQNKLHLLQKEQVLKSFCTSLKDFLEIDDIKILISSIFDVEFILNSFKENQVLVNELPNFDDFFLSLSPILLRAVLEHDLDHEDRERLLKGWLEALRIALEEELYIWQEKII